MTTLLQQAIDLAQAGDRAAAEELLQQVVDNQPDNEVAWMWLSAVTADVEIKRQALRQALALNPNNDLAQKGLALFGTISAPAAPVESPPAPEEPEPPGVPSFDWMDMGEDTPEAPPAVALPEDELPPTANWGLLSDDVTPAAESGVAETPLRPTDAQFDWMNLSDDDEEPAAPVFSLGPDDDIPDADDIIPGDFNLDAPPIFDTPAEDLMPPSFDFDQPPESDPFAVPAVLDTSLPDELLTPPEPESVSDELEALFSLPADNQPGEEDVESILPPDPDLLTEPEISLEEFEHLTDVEAEEAISHDFRQEMKERSRRQNRVLIIITAFISVLIIGGCGLYYYLFQIADLYTLIPPLAGPELTVKAPRPRDGVSVLKFKGYPAYRVKIEWEVDTEAETCTGASGLEVDFLNGDTIKLNNRLCSDTACVYEKEISPGPIRDATVTYKCGKNAIITLYHQP